MRHRLIALFLCLLPAAVFAIPSSTLHVNESATRFLLQEGEASVVLALENQGPAVANARITLELIDPDGVVRASAASDASVRSGPDFLTIPLKKNARFSYGNSKLIWYRLKYRVAMQAGEGPVSGIISLSEITPYIFRLLVTAPQEAGKDTKYAIRASTSHPLSGKPIGGVKLQALMTYDDENDNERNLKTTGVTDSDGDARLEFKLPSPLKTNDIKIKVVAEGESFSQEAEEDISLLFLNRIIVGTDKPLYQPGQALHMRVLAFDRDMKAIRNAEGTLKLRDPEGTYIFRSTFKTSRFGVASVDWPISENARLGDYWIEVWLGEESPYNAPGGAEFKISRYDLPNFAVKVKTDRSYYLPGQNAEAEIRADYLFGKPVKRGHVRVVRETERRWNYREQKWDITEEEQYEGELDDQGRFVARIDLGKEHEAFSPDRYRQFSDIRYAAYLTDATTGRTEQRRFDLRISRDQIHVYLIERDNAGEGMPMQFYISASYADGSPAQCEVSFSLQADEKTEQSLLNVKTNSYGVAKATLPDAVRVDERGSLEISARDEQGRSGKTVYERYDRDSASTRVETEKAIYRAGEPIRARIVSNSEYTNIIVDLLRGYQLLATQKVRLKDGKAEVTFPFSPGFKDELTIIAYPTFAEESEAYNLTGFRRIIYPRERELKLDLALDQPSYRPGDEARLDLRVLGPGGRGVESALGVLVFDKAVEERARTDQDFHGRSFGFYDCFRGLLGAEEGLAGITRRDLNKIDLSKPLPEGFDLVAEILLNQGYHDYHPKFFGGEITTEAESAFREAISAQLKPIGNELEFQYATKSIYPTDESGWRREMLLAGIDPGSLLDPWGVPYRAGFSMQKTEDQFQLISAGPDKRFGSDDDLTALRMSWHYFGNTSQAISRAVQSYHLRTGKFIRDRETLMRELRREAIDLDLLRDRWGNPYRFEFGAEVRNFYIRVLSGGPNGRFEDETEKRRLGSDDFIVATCLIDYTAETSALIKHALTAHYEKTGLIPKDDGELREALKGSNLDFTEMHDGWDHSFYETFKTVSYYTDRVKQWDQARYGDKPKQKTEITPVVQQILQINVRSAGPDGKEGTADDFDVTEYSQVIAEESAKEAVDKSDTRRISFSGDGGVIAGTVKDPTGAGMSGVTVTAKHLKEESAWVGKTTESGGYLLSLPPGVYEVRFEAEGFQATVITDVLVRSAQLTKLDATLNVGTMSEMVMVSAGPPQSLMTASSESVVTKSTESVNGTGRPQQLSTPRLREYFPETLVWQPLLETDGQGRARLKLKLADNITTWKLSVVGSTVDGEIGIAEKEFSAFQPFFAEHDPPKVLTEGDEISLPIVVRNYLDKTQTVQAEIKPESWFALLSPGRKQVEVKSGEAGKVIFDFRATASVKDGKQRVTMFGSDASDAIERPVAVHPDGEENVMTASSVFNEAGSLEIDVPETAIKGSARAELKIYPNLMAHALEGIEGILQRPYGCGEQTISSTYPNIMILRYLQPQGERLSAPMRKVAERARRYAQAGYERLLGYRAEDGGFTYWGKGAPDVALTAYALRFLNDARDFIAVDEDVIEKARKFLISSQQPDGRWIAFRYAGEKEDEKRAALNTAFIARVLAMEGKKQDKNLTTAVGRSLDYLAQRIDEREEPYLIASYTLAAISAGEKARAAKAAAILKALAHEEGESSYWHLETNTPFYGWGLAGRIETTALAMKALKEAERSGGKKDETGIIDRGLLFLLRNKDRYGVWLSTQATINVLDTLISLNDEEVLKSGSSGNAEVIVNGKGTVAVVLPPAGQPANPITVDLSPFLKPGQNKVEIRRERGAARASVQAVETHYEPWRNAARRENVELSNASALRLSVDFDRSNAKIGEEIICSVKAERIGHGGYGMMLAEIGLPPGADVDRESLERA
ncbi:MAG: carboxypeptidase regulatory-like domain-containing protein, partial [Blastocatellia bacterium]|nr:carboxypeptidase regulatory-like domain-containing protein [Blastocatellia bacterium]